MFDPSVHASAGMWFPARFASNREASFDNPFDNGYHFGMNKVKIPKEHYPLIAAMRLSGSRWTDIAAIYNCHPGSLRNLKDDIMEGTSEADATTKSSIASTVALYIALTAEKDEHRLNAAKSLMNEKEPLEGDGSDGSVKDDESIVIEVKRELSSSR